MASRFVIPFSRGGFMADPLLDLHREMNRLFEDAFEGGRPSRGAGNDNLMVPPRIDVKESEGELSITADIPGVQQSDLDVRIDGDVLTLSGERKNDNEQKQGSYHVMERSYGRFQRSVQLPFTPDPQQVKANFEHGVLTIRVPRQAQQERSRRIQIGTGSNASSSQGNGGSSIGTGGGNTEQLGSSGGGAGAGQSSQSGSSQQQQQQGGQSSQQEGSLSSVGSGAGPGHNGSGTSSASSNEGGARAG